MNSNLNGLYRRIEKATEAIEMLEQAKQPHARVVLYDPETGEPLISTPDTFQYGRIWLPVKEYLFNPDVDGCEP